MTRDEAVKIFKCKKIGSDWEGDWVDRFVQLGILKLDGPKTITDKIKECFAAEGYGFLSYGEFLELMDKQGLMIVEKNGVRQAGT